MCEVTTIMAVGTLVLGAASAYNQREAGKAQAQIYEQEERIDRAAAADAMAQGDTQTERMLWRTRQALGQQRAAIAANGLDAAFGTPNELLGETTMFGQMEMADARSAAARSAWGYNVSGTNAGNRADYSRWSGKTQATGTALGSLFQAGSMAYGSGAFSSGASARSGANLSSQANRITANNNARLRASYGI